MSTSRVAGYVCLALLCMALAGCGFRFRGSTEALADVGVLFVDAARQVTIGKPLTQALAARDFVVAENRDTADVILRLQDEQIRERIVSVQKTGRVSELELSHSVSLTISRATRGPGNAASIDSDVQPNPAPQANRVDVTREYTYDENGVLGKAEEATTLRAEMRDELVRQVMLRTIASLSSTHSVAELPIDAAAQ